MGLHGRLGQHQLRRDLAVGQALRDQHQHLALALGQPSSPWCAAPRWCRQHRREAVEQPAGGAGATTASPLCTARIAVEQIARRHVLEHEAAGARP